MTFAPASRNACVTYAPRPPLAPVTSTTLFFIARAPIFSLAIRFVPLFKVTAIQKKTEFSKVLSLTDLPPAMEHAAKARAWSASSLRKEGGTRQLLTAVEF